MRRFHPLIVALCLLMPGAIATPASAQPAEQVVPGDPLAAAREALPRSLDRARELAEAELAAAATADPAAALPRWPFWPDWNSAHATRIGRAPFWTPWMP